MHPKKRPSSKKEKSLEAKLVVFEEKLKTIASLGQVIQLQRSINLEANASHLYMFGAVGQVVATIATQSQTSAQTIASIGEESLPNL